MEFNCPKCNTEFEGETSLAGQWVECSECEEDFEVPAPKKRRTRQPTPPPRKPRSMKLVFIVAGLLCAVLLVFVYLDKRGKGNKASEADVPDLSASTVPLVEDRQVRQKKSPRNYINLDEPIVLRRHDDEKDMLNISGLLWRMKYIWPDEFLRHEQLVDNPLVFKGVFQGSVPTPTHSYGTLMYNEYCKIDYCKYDFETGILGLRLVTEYRILFVASSNPRIEDSEGNLNGMVTIPVFVKMEREKARLIKSRYGRGLKVALVFSIRGYKKTEKSFWVKSRRCTIPIYTIDPDVISIKFE